MNLRFGSSKEKYVRLFIAGFQLSYIQSDIIFLLVLLYFIIIFIRFIVYLVALYLKSAVAFKHLRFNKRPSVAFKQFVYKVISLQNRVLFSFSLCNLQLFITPEYVTSGIFNGLMNENRFITCNVSQHNESFCGKTFLRRSIRRNHGSPTKFTQKLLPPCFWYSENLRELSHFLKRRPTYYGVLLFKRFSKTFRNLIRRRLRLDSFRNFK